MYTRSYSGPLFPLKPDPREPTTDTETNTTHRGEARLVQPEGGLQCLLRPDSKPGHVYSNYTQDNLSLFLTKNTHADTSFQSVHKM